MQSILRPQIDLQLRGFLLKTISLVCRNAESQKNLDFSKKFTKSYVFCPLKKNVSILHLKFFGASGGYHDTPKSFGCLRRATIDYTKKFAHYFNASILVSPRRNATGNPLITHDSVVLQKAFTNIGIYHWEVQADIAYSINICVL